MSNIDDMIPDFDEVVTPPATNLLAPVEAEVIMLSESASTDLILQTYEACKFYTAEIKRLKALCEAVMIEKIKASGALEVRPGIRYIVTVDKTTKCDNVPMAVEAILNAVGGDFTKFCGVLSSNALKHGAAKKILAPEDYEKLFKVTVKDSLEEKGEPKKKLAKIDERFL